jgi:flavin-dependent dehydrogenase
VEKGYEIFASDVVIIGAGPAGSFAASEIAKKGSRFF